MVITNIPADHKDGLTYIKSKYTEKWTKDDAEAIHQYYCAFEDVQERINFAAHIMVTAYEHSNNMLFDSSVYLDCYNYWVQVIKESGLSVTEYMNLYEQDR